MLPVIIN